MEERKIKEIEYYDDQAQINSVNQNKEAGSLSDFDPFLLESYLFLKDLSKNNLKDKKILDYGCGAGVHLLWLSEISMEVVGIDLSKNSIAKAQNRITEEGSRNVKVIIGDCEKTGIADESFDAVFDGGTFSSLDLDSAIKEIHRLLKPGGILLGIETLGHNPFTNLKRQINKILGKRTSFATNHIFKISDLEKLKTYFNIDKIHFFHIVSWIAFPFLNLPGGKLLLKLLEKIDSIILFTFPFLKKYSFKIVFVAKKSQKTP